MPTSVELRSGLTKAEVDSILSYDPETGVFTRKVKRSRYLPGERAGRVHHSGYETLKINGCYLSAHRVAWLVMTGEWPEEDIDHIDRNRSNNRWSNLRAASREQNSRYAMRPKRSSCGVRGVTEFDRSFIAYISVGGGKTKRKRFSDLQEAAAWRLDMERKYYGDFAPSQTKRLLAAA